MHARDGLAGARVGASECNGDRLVARLSPEVFFVHVLHTTQVAVSEHVVRVSRPVVINEKKKQKQKKK